jgi:phosphoglycerol transferase MdoB-like AlkP superfamily enzyme
MAINYGVLALVSIAYLGVLFVVSRITWKAATTRRAFLASVTQGVLFACVALPTYVAVAALFRHEPFGIGGLQRSSEEYLPAAGLAFFSILALTAVIAMVAAARRREGDGARIAATGAAVLLFLVLVLPLAEVANACYVGQGFVIKPSC